jgi:nitroreductase
MTEDMGLFDAIYHSRAMRRLKPDPVPEALLVKLIDAGNQAPSGSNAQNGRWIVVRDQAVKRRLAELNKEAVSRYAGALRTDVPG